MKIFLIDIVKPPGTYNGMDGSIIHKWELIKNLLERGHDVHTLTYEEYIINVTGLHYHIIPSKKSSRLKNALFLLRIIKSYNFDILYTRTHANIVGGITGYIAKKIYGIPLVFELNGLTADEQELMRHKFKAENIILSVVIRLRKFKEILMWNRADAIITVTDQLKKKLVKKGIEANKIFVIENGANIDLFRPMNQDVIKEELKLDLKNKYICFVGSLAPWHGLEYLIKSAPLVIEEIEARFLIVGDGVMRKELEKMVNDSKLKDYFIFTGLIPYEEVPKYINASDVCVSPFIVERNEKTGLSPLKIYEYMACEKPVISSRFPNLEFIEMQNAGILVEPENSYELAKALIEILKNEITQNNFKKSRDYVVAYHSWESVTKKVINVCENTLKIKN